MALQQRIGVSPYGFPLDTSFDDRYIAQALSDNPNIDRPGYRPPPEAGILPPDVLSGIESNRGLGAPAEDPNNLGFLAKEGLSTGAMVPAAESIGDATEFITKTGIGGEKPKIDGGELAGKISGVATTALEFGAQIAEPTKEGPGVGGFISNMGKGAATGAMVGGPWGAAVGAAVGLGTSIVGEVQAKELREIEAAKKAKKRGEYMKATGAIQYKGGGIVKGYIPQYQEGGKVNAVLHKGEVVLNEDQQKQVLNGGSKAFKKLLDEFETKPTEYTDMKDGTPRVEDIKAEFITPESPITSGIVPDYMGASSIEKGIIGESVPGFQKGGEVKGNEAEAIYSLLLKWGVKNPNAVLAQAIHETGNFTSNIFKENNNPFGMKNPDERNTLSRGENRGHAIYENIEDAVRDYAIYQKEGNIQKYLDGDISDDQYIESLGKAGYATDKNYTDSLKTALVKTEKVLPKTVESLSELYPAEEKTGLPPLSEFRKLAEEEMRRAYASEATRAPVIEKTLTGKAPTGEMPVTEGAPSIKFPKTKEPVSRESLYDGSTKGGGKLTKALPAKPLPTTKTDKQRLLETLGKEAEYYTPTVGDVGFEKATPEEMFGAKPTGKEATKEYLKRHAISLAMLPIAARGAMKDLPEWEIPAGMEQYVGKLKSLSEQPLTATEEASLSRQAERGFRAGVQQLKTFSPQRQLAAMPALTQNLFKAETDIQNIKSQLQRKYLSDYGQALGQYIDLDRQLFEDQYQEELINKQAASELLGGTIENIRQEEMFNQYYGPGTYFQGLQKAQTQQTLEDINLTREMMAKGKAAGAQKAEFFEDWTRRYKDVQALPQDVKLSEEEFGKYLEPTVQ